MPLSVKLMLPMAALSLLALGLATYLFHQDNPQHWLWGLAVGAVVAGEVRKLAVKTAAEAQEIATLVKGIQASVGEAVSGFPGSRCAG